MLGAHRRSGKVMQRYPINCRRHATARLLAMAWRSALVWMADDGPR
jgi:hypothetical protein